MSLNIKNARTVALVRELAERTGESQTSAVEAAVVARLAQLDIRDTSAREARNARAHALLAGLHRGVTDDHRAAVTAAQGALYDEAGIPQ